MPRSAEHGRANHESAIHSAIAKRLETHSRFTQLKPEDRATLLAELTAQAETRLGAALGPSMNADQTKRFYSLVEQNAPAEQWQQFWLEIPGFQDKAAETLTAFLLEIDSLANS